MTIAVRGKAKEVILAEALRLFASRGVEAVSVRDIAASTGYSNPALFRHFASKEALAEVLFEQCYRALVDALEQAADQPLVGWLQAAIAEIARSPESVLFVLDNLKRYWATLPHELKRRAIPVLSAELVAREVARGGMRADVEPQLIGTVLFGTLGQVARSVHFYDVVIDPGDMAQRLAGLLTEGLAPR